MVRLRTLRSQHFGRCLLALSVGVFAASTSGCYKRVVGVKNSPGYTGSVYESNLGEGKQEGNESLFQIEKRTYKGTTYID